MAHPPSIYTDPNSIPQLAFPSLPFLNHQYTFLYNLRNPPPCSSRRLLFSAPLPSPRRRHPSSTPLPDPIATTPSPRGIPRPFAAARGLTRKNALIDTSAPRRPTASATSRASTTRAASGRACPTTRTGHLCLPSNTERLSHGKHYRFSSWQWSLRPSVLLKKKTPSETPPSESRQIEQNWAVTQPPHPGPSWEVTTANRTKAI